MYRIIFKKIRWDHVPWNFMDTILVKQMYDFCVSNHLFDTYHIHVVLYAAVYFKINTFKNYLYKYITYLKYFMSKNKSI